MHTTRTTQTNQPARLTVRDCPHTNLAPWGGCDDCGGSAADVSATQARKAYEVKMDAMTPADIAAARAAADQTRAADQAKPLFPWRARNH